MRLARSTSTAALFAAGFAAALGLGTWLAPRPAHGCDPVPCWDLETEEAFLTVTASTVDGQPTSVTPGDRPLRLWGLAPGATEQAQTLSVHLYDPLMPRASGCGLRAERVP